jgi:serine/threonine protein kinase
MPITAGTKLGAYELTGLLGSGGMGEVYRALDPRLQREVAIKVLPASFAADTERLHRFEQEARAAAGLNHPNILAVYDIGTQDDAPFIVSELLEGETLRERLRSGPLTVRKAMDYAQQIARGLGAAHEKGIIHRDLKPENIFITHDGRVKILDFGLAKLTSPEPVLDGRTQSINSHPGTVIGTVGYMSPEQIRGKQADARSDLFSFGAILYEMLSGQRAFQGETMADTMSAILHHEPPELSESTLAMSPSLDRLVRHCLEKSPAERFQSARDVAFGLDTLINVSSPSKSGADLQTPDRASHSRRKLFTLVGLLALAVALVGLGGWLDRRTNSSPPPRYQQITFRTGFIGNARFTPDGSIVYDAIWEGGERKQQLYLARTDDNGSRELGLKDASLLSVSRNGELAVRLRTISLYGYERIGTLARMPLSGGAPREVLENVQGADWAANGESMAIVRYLPENSHWRLEYPIGNVLLDSVNWLSHPKISRDEKYVAFIDHENTEGDDQGTVAVIGPDHREKKLSSGWNSVEGVLWSPTGDEVWFSASNLGASDDLRGVTLSGKLRTITNVPGGMWLQDFHDGRALVLTHRVRLNLRGMPPGGSQERELGWMGWSFMRAITPDGRKVLFEEQGDGGGPNYTVFLRDTDGSPPVRIGDGIGLAISSDAKWVVTKPAKGGQLSLVPTGAGEARQLTHDSINYGIVRFLPNGQQLLATGIEVGHGARDYQIDLSNGIAKPITPEGIVGVVLSYDGRNVAVTGPDGKWAYWPLDGGGLHPIPGLDARYNVVGWTPDGGSVYARSREGNLDCSPARIFRVNIATGKMDFWKEFGSNLPGGAGNPHFPKDPSAYAYSYTQTQTEAYVVTGLK